MIEPIVIDGTTRLLRDLLIIGIGWVTFGLILITIGIDEILKLRGINGKHN